MFGAHLRVQLQDRALVEQAADERVHVVGALGRLGQQRGEVDVGDVGGDAALRGEQGGELSALGPSASASSSATTWTTPERRAVGVGAAEAQHVDVLAGDRADDVRAGDEDAALRGEDHDVGERRTVGGAAGGRARARPRSAGSCPTPGSSRRRPARRRAGDRTPSASRAPPECQMPTIGTRSTIARR